MTADKRKSPQPARVSIKTLGKWHQFVGLASAVFALILVFTGLLLNHSHPLGLDSQTVRSPWLLDWYGIKSPSQLSSYPTDAGWISQLDNRLYLQAQEIPGQYGPLQGAVLVETGYAIATVDEVILVSPSGALIEVLAAQHGLPEGITAIGRVGEQVYVRTQGGLYATDKNFIQWRRRPRTSVQWSESATSPPVLQAELTRLYRSQQLTRERVLQDLHSGRLFGPLGVFIVDLAALGILILTITGLWIWAQRKKEKTQNKKTGRSKA